MLPAFKRRTADVGRVLPQLYLHGLAHGDVDLALRGLLGAGAPLSPASIARLKAGWQAEYEAWKRRSVAELEVVALWVDGVYVTWYYCVVVDGWCHRTTAPSVAPEPDRTSRRVS
ncbi:MAG TPA: transposase [Candidatus Tectomicrobia bacterium]|nr:transposase [Candidatus Tectomicrobia bacterium]